MDCFAPSSSTRRRQGVVSVISWPFRHGEMSWAYNEIDPVAALGGDVCCQISTSFVLFKDAKFHGLNDYHPINDNL